MRHAAHPLCPRCAAHRHLKRLAAKGDPEPGAFLFPAGGRRPAAHKARLGGDVPDGAWHRGLPDNVHRRGGAPPLHLWRKGREWRGATFLALRSVAIIQLIGRWASTLVETYTQHRRGAYGNGRPLRRRLKDAQGGPCARRTQPNAATDGWGYVLRPDGKVYYDHRVIPKWFVKRCSARKVCISRGLCPARRLRHVRGAPAAVDRGLHRQYGGSGGFVQRIWQRSGGSWRDLGLLDPDFARVRR